MSRPVNPNVPEDGFKSKKDFEDTGTINYLDFSITAGVPTNKQILFDPTGQTAGKSVTIAAGANTSNITLTLPSAAGTLARLSDITGGISAFVAWEEQASGTNGGDATSGAWRQRVLNNSNDSSTGITISSNQLIMPAGTYLVYAIQPFHGIVNRANSRLQNITDSTTILNGSTVCETGGGSTFHSYCAGIFTLAAQKTVEMEYQVQTTVTSTGLGFASGGIFAVGKEVYSQIIILKLA